MVSAEVARHDLPRLLLAAPASGSGKTMVTTGVLAALCARGLEVSPHKVGPDYIDPGYHAAACGRPGRNLDVHLVGEQRIVPLLLHGAATPLPADVAIIEGVMGLFDGSLGGEGYASSAHVATLTATPVVLVVNCASASRSVGATVLGFARFDADVTVAGVILNNVASPRHEAEVRQAVAGLGIPVVGVIPRLADIVVPSRHLGLIPAAERRPEALEAVAALAAMAEQYLDLDLMLSLAREAPALTGERWSPEAAVREAGAPTPSGTDDGPLVAVAGGSAFTFGYTEAAELLRAAGARVVGVDPVSDELPAGLDALVIPGGFPQVYAGSLAANTAMRQSVRAFARAGGPIVAECAGLLYLGESLDGAEMCGVLPITAAMSPKLTLGYRRAVAACDSVLAAQGECVTGHVFHRTRVTPVGDGAGTRAAWRLEDHQGQVEMEGLVADSGSVHASYLHTHWAGNPRLPVRFVAAARGEAR